MQSKAKTVTAYLAELPSERRAAMQKVRAAIKKYLPKGYEETMQYGMPCWVVPLRTYPTGYRNDPTVPVMFAGLASQKTGMSLHMLCLYGGGDELRMRFEKAYKASGKKLDMGMGCIRFKKPEDLALDVIGKMVSSIPVKKFIANYESARSKVKSASRPAAKKRP